MKDKRLWIVAIVCVIWFVIEPKPEPIATWILAVIFMEV
jgi:hypothetical protein